MKEELRAQYVKSLESRIETIDTLKENFMRVMNSLTRIFVCLPTSSMAQAQRSAFM